MTESSSWLRDKWRTFTFTQSLLQLLRAHPAYSDTDPTPKKGPGPDAYIPDITTRRDGRLVVIECKGVAPMVRGRVESALKELDRLQATYPDAIIVFALPEPLLEDYRSSLSGKGFEVWDLEAIAREFGGQITAVSDASFREVLRTAAQPRVGVDHGAELRSRLKSTPCGRKCWAEYQRLCVEILEYLFVPPLSSPLYEHSDEPRVNRRDVVLPNYAVDGVWLNLRAKYSADFVVVDAKNYCAKVKKNDVLQIANYLKPAGAGMFGIICTRVGVSPTARLIRREQWTLYGKMIVMLTDDDLIQMLALRATGGEPELVIRQSIEDFRLGL